MPYKEKDIDYIKRLEKENAELREKYRKIRQRLMDKLGQDIETYEEQQSTIDRLYGALDELCTLKDIKDKFGKTEWYLIRQPKAWVKARELIEQHKG